MPGSIVARDLLRAGVAPTSAGLLRACISCRWFGRAQARASLAPAHTAEASRFPHTPSIADRATTSALTQIILAARGACSAQSDDELLTLPSTHARTMHLFTVDLEEYFQAAALEPYVGRERWNKIPSRVEAATDYLLAVLAEHGATATFFTLGLVAERTPAVVRRIAEAGHEVASHGWSHRRVDSLTPADFRTEIARSRDLLEQVSGQSVIGYRAPNFSIVAGCSWAYPILLEEGYSYDSSAFPGRASGRHYMSIMQAAPPSPHPTIVPLSCAQFGRLVVPAAGGAWFRLFPYALTRRALLQAEWRGEAGVFYIHPWELDPTQPRLPVRTLTRVRHYGGLQRTRERLERLLREFRFTSVAQWLEAKAAAAA